MPAQASEDIWLLHYFRLETIGSKLSNQTLLTISLQDTKILTKLKGENCRPHI